MSLGGFFTSRGQPEAMSRGRPTTYREEYAKTAYKLSMLGMTDAQMAGVFDISEAGFYKWKLKYPELVEAIKKGKDDSDADVAVSLYKRACGYSHEDTDIRVIDNKIVKTPIIKHYPPDTAAAFIWLKNRQPKMWRDKHNEDAGNEAIADLLGRLVNMLPK